MEQTFYTRPIKILHVLPGLRTGGAERVLVEVVRLTPEFEHHVISLGGRDTLADSLQAAGATVQALGASLHNAPFKLLTLRRMVAEISPDVTHGWLYLGGLATLLGVPRRLGARLIGLHATELRLSDLTLRNRLVMRFVKWYAGSFEAVVYCSPAARRFHETQGFINRRTVVILNGVDTYRFIANPVDRTAARLQLNLPADATIIGLPARFDPQKDHTNLIDAFSLLAPERPDLRLAMCGAGIDQSNQVLCDMIARIGLAGERVHLLGELMNMASVYPAFDLIAIPSAYGEALPLTVLEAMACGIAVVATDVGDTSSVLEGIGEIAPPADSKALASAVAQALDRRPEDAEARRKRGRDIIEERFSAVAMARGYASLYASLAGGDTPE